LRLEAKGNPAGRHDEQAAGLIALGDQHHESAFDQAADRRFVLGRHVDHATVGGGTPGQDLSLEV
jgi:hypothetical protein